MYKMTTIITLTLSIMLDWNKLLCGLCKLQIALQLLVLITVMLAFSSNQLCWPLDSSCSFPQSELLLHDPLPPALLSLLLSLASFSKRPWKEGIPLSFVTSLYLHSHPIPQLQLPPIYRSSTPSYHLSRSSHTLICTNTKLQKLNWFYFPRLNRLPYLFLSKIPSLFYLNIIQD